MTSSGMMEVARSGVFYPEMFTFRDVMMLFLGVMFANVILLDLFNTFGLPTSTTVSLVFGLLGAAVAVTSLKISADPTLTAADMSNYINSGKALVIISGILASVAIAFVVGAFVMFISRLIFTFRYQKMLKRFGACGAASPSPPSPTSLSSRGCRIPGYSVRPFSIRSRPTCSPSCSVSSRSARSSCSCFSSPKSTSSRLRYSPAPSRWRSPSRATTW